MCVCSLLPFSFLICSGSFSLILSFLIYKQAWSLKNPSVAITYVITIRAAPVKKNRERFEKEQRQTKSQSNPNDQSERLKISHRANENSEQINLNDIKSGKSGTHHKAEVVLNVASDWLRGWHEFWDQSQSVVKKNQQNLGFLSDTQFINCFIRKQLSYNYVFLQI